MFNKHSPDCVRCKNLNPTKHLNVKMDWVKMSNKSLDELRYLFSNLMESHQAEFIEQFPEIWDDAYDIEMGSPLS